MIEIEVKEGRKIKSNSGIIINTKGILDDVTPEMKKLLDFIDGKEPEDDFARELDEAV